MKTTILGLVVVHLAASIWHGDAHTTLGIDLTTLQSLFVYVVILATPIVSAALVWTRFALLSVGLFAFSMTGALVFGVFYHYVHVSPDNIAHLPAGLVDAQTQFIQSAALIANIELFAASAGFFMLGQAYRASR